MKYVLLIAVVLLAVWWLGRQRRAPPGASGKDPKAAGKGSPRHEPMLRCRHCGVHLPSSEAVKDAAGDVFCSADHRLAHERRDDPA